MVKNLINLFFPKICSGCRNSLGDFEHVICTSCRHELPVTNFHLQDDNPLERIFYGRIKLNRATALFYFTKKGIVQELLHNLKYRGHENIGEFLGKWLAHELISSGNFKEVDIVIPVPLHKKKLRKRGYNQVTLFAKEIATALNASYIDNVLIKTSHTETQVFKKRLARWQQRDEVFQLINATKIEGKNILIVDDIVTTGSTIEACGNVLKQANIKSLSLASMAITA